MSWAEIPYRIVSFVNVHDPLSSFRRFDHEKSPFFQDRHFKDHVECEEMEQSFLRL